ncbi:alpha-L-rhamnosidase [Anaerobacterium chartisolvens]|uniref:alpha-L-rhamnosidase n=1 Tax=Anaerobacterium chartisolvens TaxID=1297424 RepID=A0A369B2F3_9FIRM|nr:alpha-L-rhamnosidase [Anaerobacterium chartisolvens]RCX13884.1 alpha-L-rhamnosidase [Anaerobacterium chartisolvens]
MSILKVKSLKVENQNYPMGMDCTKPRFSWELASDGKNIVQTAYNLIVINEEGKRIADTGKIDSDESIEVTIADLKLEPMTGYMVQVTVWDNEGNQAVTEGGFETGRFETAWKASWAEPVQIPTKASNLGGNLTMESVLENSNSKKERDFSEFQPAQYIRIPLKAKKGLKKARAYVTAHGVYRLEVNGVRPDDREFAPENTSYAGILQYQTYNITSLLKGEENIAGIILGDGWWTGRVGMTGDSCQYGETIGLLFEAILTYEDGTSEVVTGEAGKSSTGPIVFSDIFVGEKYDARKEMQNWSCPEFDDSKWKPLHKVEYPMNNLVGQYGEPVRPIRIFEPKEIIETPIGETVLDVGQVLAGQLEFTIDAPEGIQIKLEHSEVLDDKGNYYNNIIGVNKEQTEIYITKEGKQTYRPVFSYHGFRYIRISGWPGAISVKDFKVYALSSEMRDISEFTTSNLKINQLQSNIWWSQVSNTLSIPTDCPQRERAGWTGDIMAFSPTLCFNRGANTFLSRWMANVRTEQLENGAIPMIVPYLEAYKAMAKNFIGSDTSCGWGDAVIQVPVAVYKAYGDKRILEENYTAMTRWMNYIADRVQNNHPEGYEEWDDERKARSHYLWNTDFHFGDWLVPSMVLGNPDGMAMMKTAYATMAFVAPAYYAFSAKSMVEVAEALGKTKDAENYRDLYNKIREAFIKEYVHDDGTMDADLQGIYVIALKNGLVSDEVRPKMAAHLCKMIEKNRGCLDTGFLSVLFILDVLCENGYRNEAYKLIFQNQCPSWLYEVEHGATTIWESWGAIEEDGTVSTYSYNHYAFGCVGEWMYREMGGLKAAEPGYKKICVAPALDCGLLFARVSEHTPYGIASVDWKLENGKAEVKVEIPVNTTAEVILPGMDKIDIGSGFYVFEVKL